jgi:sugar phosphate isomerase/epimerase
MQVSVFTKVFDDRSLTEAAEAATDLGLDGIDPMGRLPHLPPEADPDEAAALRERLDDLGLSVPCLGTYTGGYTGQSEAACEAELDDLERCCELAEILETDLVRHWAGGPPVHEAEEADYEAEAAWLRRAADVAADHEKRLALEIHHGSLIETADSTRKLLDLVDRDRVGAILDPGNMFIVGADYGRGAVETLGDRLFHVHVKDEARVEDPDLPGAFITETSRGEETFQARRLGEGEVDHAPAIEALRERDYEGAIALECHVPAETRAEAEAHAAHDRDHVRDLLS